MMRPSDACAVHICPPACFWLLGVPALMAHARAEQVHASNVERPAPWALDRLDQAQLPLNGEFDYSNAGTGVNVYVVDTARLPLRIPWGCLSRRCHWRVIAARPWGCLFKRLPFLCMPRCRPALAWLFLERQVGLCMPACSCAAMKAGCALNQATTRPCTKLCVGQCMGLEVRVLKHALHRASW
jgi:hypothetical protein